MTRREKLANLKQRATDIQTILAPWKGLTHEETLNQGCKLDFEKLQGELWGLGFRIIQLENQLKSI